MVILTNKNEIANSTRLVIYGLFFLIFIEFLLFRTSFVVNFQPYFPRAWDQTGYISAAYATYYSIHDQGWLNTLLQIDTLQPLFKGPILQNTMVALMFLFGPDRLSAVYANFLFFLIGQIILFFYFSVRVNTSAGLVAVGLYLFGNTHYFWAGGLMDLRLDYAGMVTFGIAFLAYLSLIERPEKTSLVLACIATFVTLATRSITGVYAALILIVLVSIFSLNLKYRFFKRIDATHARYFFYLLIVFCGISGIALIFLGGDVAAYYGGMFKGLERSIRAAEFGATNVWANVLYYPKSALTHFLYYGYVLVIMALFQGFKIASQSNSSPQKRVATDLGVDSCLFLLLVFSFSVWACLGAYSQSPLVIGVLTIPIVVALTFLISIQLRSMPARVRSLTSVAIAFAGFIFYISQIVSPTYLAQHHFIDARKVNLLYQDIQDILEEVTAHRTLPLRMQWMVFSEEFLPEILNVYLYEHDGRFELPMIQSRGWSIFSATESDISNAIDQADLVVAPLQFNPSAGFEYPVTHSMRQHENFWRKKLEAEFKLEHRYKLSTASDIGLYIRSCQLTEFIIPNSLEFEDSNPMFWLGTDRAQVTITNIAETSLAATLTAFAYPGPSNPNAEERTLAYEINGIHQELVLRNSTPWQLNVPMLLQPGRNTLYLWATDAADIGLNLNGDVRELLIRVANMSVACQ